MNQYPTILLHGFMGFGEGAWINDYLLPYWGFKFFWNKKHNLIPHLKEQGYEVYNPALGPWNSDWDRCCTLYAYIVGGTVDYGKAHSEKYGHNRYGRTFPGIIKDWGQPGPHEKINVIGHSLGGLSVIAFSDMLMRGSEEERACTPPEELSPLFEGGHGDLLHCVATLAGVNNGTTMASKLTENDFGYKVTKAVCTGVGVIGRNGFVMKFWDQMLDQWNISADPAKKVGFSKFGKKEEYAAGAEAYASSKDDNVGWQMTLQHMAEANKDRKPNPNTYYFAYAGDASELKKNGSAKPIWNNMNFVCYFAGFLTGSAWSDKMAAVYPQYPNKSDWVANDGFVNVIGQRAPFNMPQEEFEKGRPVKPGIWYNMPLEYQCHLSWNGAHIPAKKFFATMDDMFARFAALD